MGSGYKILVVDDNWNNRGVVRELLDLRWWKPKMAKKGIETPSKTSQT